MISLKINLLEEKQVSPIVNLWRRRLYLILASVCVILLFDGIAILFVRTVLLARSKELQERLTQVTTTIDKKKEIEGLYLTLVSRLELIDSTKKETAQLELLPETMDNLLGDSIKMVSFSIDNTSKKEAELSLETDDPDAVKSILDKLASFKTEELSFSNIVIKSTEVDEEGNYSIDLSLSLNKQVSPAEQD